MSMAENKIKEATLEDAIYCAKGFVGLEVCEECRFYGLCHTWCNDVYRIIVDALEEIQAYRAIDTVEDFKGLKEKNEPKKPQEISWGATNCPICGQEFGFNSHFNHCPNCGQKLDFGKEE